MNVNTKAALDVLKAVSVLLAELEPPAIKAVEAKPSRVVPLINGHRKPGRPSRYTGEDIRKMQALRKDGASVDALTKKFKCTAGTVRRLLGK